MATPLTTSDPTLAVVIERLDQIKIARAEDRVELTATFAAIELKRDAERAEISARFDKMEAAVTKRLDRGDEIIGGIQTTMNRAKGGWLVIIGIGGLLAWVADVPARIFPGIFGGNA